MLRHHFWRPQPAPRLSVLPSSARWWGCPAAQGNDGIHVPGDCFSHRAARRRSEGAGRQQAPTRMTADQS